MSGATLLAPVRGAAYEPGTCSSPRPSGPSWGQRRACIAAAAKTMCMTSMSYGRVS